ncbi:MAG: hypothetical protein JHC95_13305 [Solirubrobacteraceae bacterium]|nr:hypothetical protein [Solirubrobacteraceae bacterium]
MPTFQDENLVMWRNYAHLVPLMDLLRLRHAGWVVESTEDAGVHLGVLHAAAEHATPIDAAKYLDTQAALDRQKRTQERALREGTKPAKQRGGGDRAGTAGVRTRKDEEAPAKGRVTTTRAKNASRRSNRRHSR